MAAAGTLTLLVGAEPAHVDAARDILGAVATTIHHFGPHGTGTIYKLLVNLLGAIQIASAAEALALAERAGLDPALVTRALSTGQAASPQVVRHLRRFAGDETSQDVTFTAALRLKDTRYGAALFRELGQASAFGDAAVALYERLCAMGLGESTESRIIDLFRK